MRTLDYHDRARQRQGSLCCPNQYRPWVIGL